MSDKDLIPQYEPKNKKISIKDCVDSSVAKKLIREINIANISQEEKNFLLLAAQRHIVFNYKNIADYYANATKEMQILMEHSGLVIVDVDDAIANGFVKLYDELEKIEGE